MFASTYKATFSPAAPHIQTSRPICVMRHVQHRLPVAYKLSDRSLGYVRVSLKNALGKVLLRAEHLGGPVHASRDRVSAITLAIRRVIWEGYLSWLRPSFLRETFPKSIYYRRNVPTPFISVVQSFSCGSPCINIGETRVRFTRSDSAGDITPGHSFSGS